MLPQWQLSYKCEIGLQDAPVYVVLPAPIAGLPAALCLWTSSLLMTCPSIKSKLLAGHVHSL
jgi:hypothetical protein